MVDQQPADGVIGQAVFGGCSHKFGGSRYWVSPLGVPIHRVRRCPAARLITEFDGRVPWVPVEHDKLVTIEAASPSSVPEPEIAVVGLRNRSNGSGGGRAAGSKWFWNIGLAPCGV